LDAVPPDSFQAECGVLASWLDQLHHVPVGIVDADGTVEAELGPRGVDPARRDEPAATPRELRRRLGGVAGDEARLPVREVVGPAAVTKAEFTLVEAA
jgi:hypothetical protein